MQRKIEPHGIRLQKTLGSTVNTQEYQLRVDPSRKFLYLFFAWLAEVVDRGLGRSPNIFLKKALLISNPSGFNLRLHHLLRRNLARFAPIAFTWLGSPIFHKPLFVKKVLPQVRKSNAVRVPPPLIPKSCFILTLRLSALLQTR
jgi:hypothetical protein